MSVKPVSSSMNLTLAQLLPPSVVLKMPRSVFGPNRWPSSGDVHDVVVLRVDDDARDGLGLFQPDVREGLAAVGRFVDAVAEGLELCRLFGSPVPTQTMFGSDWQTAMSPIEDVRVGVEDRLTGRAVVDRLPNAAGRKAHVDR